MHIREALPPHIGYNLKEDIFETTLYLVHRHLFNNLADKYRQLVDHVVTENIEAI